MKMVRLLTISLILNISIHMAVAPIVNDEISIISMEHDVLKFPAAINKIRKMLNFRQNWIEKVTLSKCKEHMEQYPVSISCSNVPLKWQ